MQNLKRRNFLKLLSASAIVGSIPYSYAISKNSNQNVIFLDKKNNLFEKFRRPFNKRIKTQPKIIAVCQNELGVQEAVLYANIYKLNIAIKSGGHSFEGFSLNQNGMVIDVSKMNNLQLLKNNELIAEPAVRLAQLYSYCLPKGRLLPSGSCGTVGLSGITLGGGYGLFSREFGLTSDHLIGVRMVDAKGSVVDSNDLPELLWACRGAGNGNFGVVTQLRYKTVEAPKTLYQHRFRSYKLSAAKAKTLAQFWFEQTQNLPLHAYSAFIFSGDSITVMLTSTKDDIAMQNILKSFDARMDKNAQLKPDPLEVGVKYYYGRSQPLYFKNISSGFYKDFNDIKECIEKVFSLVAKTPGMLYQINTLGGAINNSPVANESAYAHRDVHYLSEAQSYWDNPKYEKRNLATMKNVQEILHNNGVDKHYINYPDINIKNYAQAYYGSSHARLKKLKSQLDPKNRFTYAQSVKLK